MPLNVWALPRKHDKTITKKTIFIGVGLQNTINSLSIWQTEIFCSATVVPVIFLQLPGLLVLLVFAHVNKDLGLVTACPASLVMTKEGI